MFDLAVSILSFMRRDEKTHWIICEGSDDKTYLEYMLKDYSNVKILPVGGCGNVLKLYYLLFNPISEKNEGKNINGKILCLIDTDLTLIQVYKPFSLSKSKTHVLDLMRLQVTEEKIELIDPTTSGTYKETAIEDCLDPRIYYEAIKNIIIESGENDIIDIFNKFKFNDRAKFSKIDGDQSIIIPKITEAFYQKDTIKDFLKDLNVKYRVASKYIEICREQNYNTHQLGDEITKVLGL